MALTDYLVSPTLTAQTYTPSTGQVTPTANIMQSNLNSFMNPNSELMQQAKLAGLNTAAARGGVNSSIAAGAAQRASLDSATEMASAATQGDVANNSAVLSTNLNNWLNTQGVNSSLFSSLYNKSYSNSLDMLSAIGALAAQDPETYTPEVMSGFTNFFQNMSNNFLKNYYGGS